MNGVEAFGWGCAGSAASEIVSSCAAIRRDRASRLPQLYRRPAFLIGRALLTLVAGALTAAWGISQPIQGFALGAATPRIIRELERLRFGLSDRED